MRLQVTDQKFQAMTRTRFGGNLITNAECSKVEELRELYSFVKLSNFGEVRNFRTKITIPPTIRMQGDLVCSSTTVTREYLKCSNRGTAHYKHQQVVEC